MTNETIEKVNNGLDKLIGAYKVLQKANHALNEDITIKDNKIKSLEDELSNVSGDSEATTSTLDEMLHKIDDIFDIEDNPKDEKQKTKETEEQLFSEINLTVGELSDDDIVEEQDGNNIDLGRMESLLNGTLNNK